MSLFSYDTQEYKVCDDVEEDSTGGDVTPFSHTNEGIVALLEVGGIAREEKNAVRCRFQSFAQDYSSVLHYCR